MHGGWSFLGRSMYRSAYTQCVVAVGRVSETGHFAAAAVFVVILHQPARSNSTLLCVRPASSFVYASHRWWSASCMLCYCSWAHAAHTQDVVCRSVGAWHMETILILVAPVVV